MWGKWETGKMNGKLKGGATERKLLRWELGKHCRCLFILKMFNNNIPILLYLTHLHCRDEDMWRLLQDLAIIFMVPKFAKKKKKKTISCHKYSRYSRKGKRRVLLHTFNTCWWISLTCSCMVCNFTAPTCHRNFESAHPQAEFVRVFNEEKTSFSRLSWIFSSISKC